MSGMGEFAFSLTMRDTIARMVKEQVDRERPRYRYATVKAIDRVSRKCDVIFNGETGTARVNMGAIQPNKIDQIVRVEGIGTDKFITDVIGQPYNGVRRGTLQPHYSSGKAKVIWEGENTYTGPYDIIGGGNVRGGEEVTSLEVPDHGIVVFPTGGKNFKPKWHRLEGLNGWIPYTSYMNWSPTAAYQYPGFTKTSAGIVKLKGLVSNPTAQASGAAMFQLPEGFRPAGMRMFPAQIGTANEGGSIDVDEEGYVRVRNAATAWTSLENVCFPSSDVAPESAWKTLAITHASIAHFRDHPQGGGNWPRMGIWQDSEGIVWRRGLGMRSSGTGTAYDFYSEPSFPAEKWLHFRATAANNAYQLLVRENGNGHIPPGIPNSYFSLDGMPYIAANSPLYVNKAKNGMVRALGGINGWVNYDAANYAAAEVIRTPSGMVYLKGLIKNGTGTVATQPVGYRPGSICLFGVTSSAGNWARIDIYPDGNMAPGGQFTSTWSSLDGICYVPEDDLYANW